MFIFKKSIFVNVPQQEVFDFVSDPANNPKWQSVSDSSEWTSDGPIGVGSTLRSVGKFLGRKLETTSEITVWDPPNRFSQKSVGGPIPFESELQFEPEGEGTQLKVSGQVEIGGFFKLAEGIVGKQAEKQMDRDFEALKKVLEGA